MREYRRIVLFVFAVGLALLVAYVVRSSLLLIYIAVVFAVVLGPAVNRVHRLRIWRWQPGRGVSILLIVAALVILATVFLLFALPPIISDVQDFASALPEHLNRLNAHIQHLPFGNRINFETLQGVIGNLVGGVPGVISEAAHVVVAIATVAILTAYLILDGKRVFEWALSLLPVQSRGRLQGTLLGAARRMRNWLVGQALLMLILGSSSAVVYGLLGLRYFFALAVFAGVANIVPMLGPIATVILASLVAAMDSFGKVLGVWIFYLVYQQVENAFLTPHIMQSQVEVSATAIVVALLLGGQLAGIAGALVAVPSAVLVSALTHEYLVKKA